LQKQNNIKKVERGKATADMEELHEEGHEKIRGWGVKMMNGIYG